MKVSDMYWCSERLLPSEQRKTAMYSADLMINALRPRKPYGLLVTGEGG